MLSDSRYQDMQCCLALYDWDGQLDQMNWSSLIIDFFQNIDLYPNVAVCCSENKWSKPISIRTLQSRLKRKMLFNSIELYLLPEKYQTFMDATAGVLFEDSGTPPQGKRSMVIAIPGNLDSKRIENFYQLCREISKQCDLRYGIGFEMPQACGPIYYGIGIVQSSDDCHFTEIEEEEISLWFRERIGSRGMEPENRHLKGKLRGVYRINIISEVHLNTNLKDNTLKNWILADSKRGVLQELNKNLSWWQIPTESIPDVYEYLMKVGVIIRENQKGVAQNKT